MNVAAYIVRRIAWDSGYSYPLCESQSAQGSYDDTTGPRHVPIATFPTEREAKADAHRRNAEARAGRSPFWFAEDWRELTDLSVDDAAARLARKGLPPPPPSRHFEEFNDYPWLICRVWQEWWDRESVNWTAEQSADAWAVFDKLRFYDVVEVEMED